MVAQHVQDLGGIYFQNFDTGVFLLKTNDYQNAYQICKKFDGELWSPATPGVYPFLDGNSLGFQTQIHLFSCK